MNRQGMNKTRFCLKTAIDDFKHESSRIFLDFRVAFGSLPHNIMIEALYEIDLPKPYINMIKDIYSGSFFQVICGDQLINPIQLRKGHQNRLHLERGKLYSSPKSLAQMVVPMLSPVHHITKSSPGLCRRCQGVI